MKKLFKSRKALSPVVAAIILIAVTVAVSIAVAAWMGALTFTFMKTEELKITGLTWDMTNKKATLSVKNSGTGALTIDSVRVNDNAVPSDNVTCSLSLTMDPGAEQTIEVTYSAFTSGTKYEIAILSETGNQYKYVSTAP